MFGIVIRNRKQSSIVAENIELY